MNDTEFSAFLKRLDADLLNWKKRLASLPVASLTVEPQEAQELRRSHTICLQVLESTREDIQPLAKKQTLKNDFLLMVDLNALVRSLDRLSSNLANPVTVKTVSTAQKSLGWAREVLAMDIALGAHKNDMERHVLALAGLVDAALERANQNADHSENRK